MTAAFGNFDEGRNGVNGISNCIGSSDGGAFRKRLHDHGTNKQGENFRPAK